MPAPDPRSYLATSKARTLAYLLDLCACGLLLVPTAYAAYCLATPSAGALQYGLLFLAYHTYFLALRHGVSPGKYIVNIAVVTTSGTPITVLQAVLRSSSLAMPWLLLSAGDAHWLASVLPAMALGVLPTAGAAWLALDAILIELTTDRRSLSDRIASTVVVNLPPPQPHRAPAVPMFSRDDAEFGHPPKRPPRP